MLLLDALEGLETMTEIIGEVVLKALSYSQRGSCTKVL